jgi:putative ABC transport system permease protein
MILNRRIIRELRSNIVRYASLFFLLLMGMTLIIGLSAATDSITETVKSHTQKNNLEDGSFSLLAPLTPEQVRELSAQGVQLEEQFYLHFNLSDGSVLRIFKNRQNINLVELNEGDNASDSNEIVLEEHYAAKHQYAVGDTISIGEDSYRIMGIGTVPDYDNVLQNISDTTANPDRFSIAFASDAGYDMLRNSRAWTSSEEFSYSYKLSSPMTAQDLKKHLLAMDSDSGDGYPSITSFIQADENPRIYASVDDAQINKIAALFFGIIYLIMIAYMISVFVVHHIEHESAVIGALYSLGYQKKDLLKHYLILPVVVIAAGGIAGTLLGLALVRELSADNTGSFSYPELNLVVAPYIIGYGVLLPIVIAVVVNLVVINKKLSQSPLKLLRKEKKSNTISNIDLGNIGFINRYRIRQILRETSGNLSLFAGLSLAILIMVFGVTVYSGISNITNDLTKDVKFDYMYVLKFPAEEVPENGEEGYTESLYTYSKYADDDLEVAVQGINADNPYYEFKIQEGTAANELTVSSSAAIKFGWNKGDQITLSNRIENKDYTFTVKDIVQYGYGLFVFMDIDSMRKLFEKDGDYYNTVLSTKSLHIESERIASLTTVEDIKRTGDVIMQQKLAMIVLVVVISVILFVIVMFLLLKMMIDKATFSISLLKIFGYSEKEIKKLYLGSNFYIVLLTAIIAMPISKMIMDKLFPYMVSNIPAGFNTTFGVVHYAAVAGIILGSYFLANLMLGRHLKKISFAKILKDRE